MHNQEIEGGSTSLYPPQISVSSLLPNLDLRRAKEEGTSHSYPDDDVFPDDGVFVFVLKRKIVSLLAHNRFCGREKIVGSAMYLACPVTLHLMAATPPA
ncbi:hypothetical protein MRB53_026447 [Persea americana]|uniref:Uncharacterized protein n=1 Tax=Persea americana TaxID=3435 RepID=A0ACC2LIR3_PERAE|nr:hypothetical protein MRB53_026447 [Persea americana]